MGAPLRRAAREIANEADVDDEDVLVLHECSFCDGDIRPGSENVAITWSAFMDLVYAGLSTLFEPGREVGNPPSDGGDGRDWFTGNAIADMHCWDAVDNGGFQLLIAIGDELDQDYWTYKNDGWDRLTRRLGWEQYQEVANGAAARFRGPLIPSPSEFLAELQKIVIEYAPDTVQILPSGTRLWRGREHCESASFTPCGTELGAAPEKFAKGNRFSPERESMFYGSTELRTALDELVSEGMPYVTAGAFITTRDLLILDLTSVDYWPSIFAPEERDAYLPIEFLREFAKDISEPIAPAGGSRFT
ncbi:hypothetical protein ACIA5E_18030 [Nocardia asteroides]|uniref:hypothetical protein n=1 Tax=Nocardia asteroides TaxID=1824 RepID=UPI003799F310